MTIIYTNEKTEVYNAFNFFDVFPECKAMFEKEFSIKLESLDWDYDKLNDLLEEIKDVDVFDCSGFDVSDVDLMEKLSDDGSLVSDSPPEEAKVPVHSLIFDFDNEADMVEVKRYFSNCKSGWKDKNKPNSKQLKGIVDNNG